MPLLKAPLVDDGVPGDLPDERPWVPHGLGPAKRSQYAQKRLLLQIRIRPAVEYSNGLADFPRDFYRTQLDFLCDLLHGSSGSVDMTDTKLIGQSDAMQILKSRIRAAARAASSVLIEGETGTGKELVARSIHDLGQSNGGRFVPVDCGAVPEDLVESELFGHRRGAFTTAVADKPGLFEEANHGTLFLDEIRNTSKRFQVKFLRVLQERQVRRLGDLVDRKLELRVIAATNCDLRAMTLSGEFREDLLYRLNVFPIQIPPLRKRKGDIPLIVASVIGELNIRNHQVRTLTNDAMKKLETYSYPGNIRELQNVVESAYYTVEAEAIGPDAIALPTDVLTPETFDEIIVDDFWESVARPYTERLITKRQVEAVIRRGLLQTQGNYRKMVRLFKMPDSDYKRFMDFLRRHRCNVDFRPYRKKAE